MSNDTSTAKGLVTWELRGPDGELKASGETNNLITDSGDLCYVSNGCGAASPTAKPTGMQIGTGSTAVAKNGAGSYITTYLIGQAFDSGYPTATDNAGSGAVATYKVTFGAGVGTTASAITEAAIVTGTVTTAGTAATTIARVLLSGIGSKGSADVLALTWTNTINGQ